MATVTSKKVNIRARGPIVGLKYPIVGTLNGVTMSTDDILICIRAKAKVEEILNDGKRIVPLDFTNYNTDNSVTTEQTTESAPKVFNVVKNDNGKLVVDKATTVVDPMLDTTSVEDTTTDTTETTVSDTKTATTTDSTKTTTYSSIFSSAKTTTTDSTKSDTGSAASTKNVHS
jgi:hypothetical protein